ncbi:MAG: hypothetical protein IPL33_22400 [Sphingobacteriales bacterium]|nr:hypothetical protein [Sphingobacteriales bacterium]MBK8474707.1 hypothetical protein [Sphingobacteriales bacterium]
MSLCYPAINLVRSNFTCYEALMRIVGGGFRLDTQKFTCYEALNRFT